MSFGSVAVDAVIDPRAALRLIKDAADEDQSPDEEARRRRLKLLALTLGGLGVAGGLGYMAYRNLRPPPPPPESGGKTVPVTDVPTALHAVEEGLRPATNALVKELLRQLGYDTDLSPLTLSGLLGSLGVATAKLPSAGIRGKPGLKTVERAIEDLGADLKVRYGPMFERKLLGRLIFGSGTDRMHEAMDQRQALSGITGSGGLGDENLARVQEGIRNLRKRRASFLDPVVRADSDTWKRPGTGIEARVGPTKRLLRIPRQRDPAKALSTIGLPFSDSRMAANVVNNLEHLLDVADENSNVQLDARGFEREARRAARRVLERMSAGSQSPVPIYINNRSDWQALTGQAPPAPAVPGKKPATAMVDEGDGLGPKRFEYRPGAGRYDAHRKLKQTLFEMRGVRRPGSLGRNIRHIAAPTLVALAPQLASRVYSWAWGNALPKHLRGQ